MPAKPTTTSKSKAGVKVFAETGDTTTAAERRANSEKRQASKGKPKAPAKAKAAPKPKKATNADKLAAIITSDFGGKAKFADLAKNAKVKRTFQSKGLLYRALQGVVTKDKSGTFKRTGPGEVAVNPKKAS